MEYVDECNNCDEKENCKNDANDEPCGYGCGSGVLDDSNLNVLGHLRPTNNGCALGQLCVHSFELAVVCNTVYDPSGNVLCFSNEQSNFCKECALVNSLGEGVTIGEDQRTVGAACNLGQSQTCGSTCESGEIGCVENGTCGNGNNDFINVAVCAGLVVAILIFISNGVSSVGNGNDNVGRRHYELAAFNCNCITGGGAVNSGVNLNFVGVTELVGNSNGDLGACKSIGLINGCVAVGVYGVVAVINSTVEVDGAGAFNQHLDGVVGNELAVHILPNIAGNFTVNGQLKGCELTVSPFSNGLFVGLNSLFVNLEVYGDLGFVVVYPEQGDIFNTELGANGILIEPVPTVSGGGLVAENAFNGGCVCIKDGVGNGLVECAVYIVVNVVNASLCKVLNGYCLCRHYKSLVIVINTIDLGLFVCNTLESCTLELCNKCLACFVPAACNVSCGCDRTYRKLGSVDGCGVNANETIFGLNVEVVLVNKGYGGEVRSLEGNCFCGYGCVNYITIHIYKGLSIVGIDTCEGQNDLNLCAVLEVADIGEDTCKVEYELSCYSAAILGETKICKCSCGSVGKTNGISTCIGADECELCEHLSIESYLLSTLCNQNEVAVKSCYKVGSHCKAESCKVLIGDELVPVLCKENGASIVGENDLIVNTVNKAFNLECCVFGVLVKVELCGNNNVCGNVCVEYCFIPSKAVCITKDCFSVGKCGIERFNCNCKVRSVNAESNAFLNLFKGLCANDLALFVLYNEGDGVGLFFGDNRFIGIFGLFYGNVSLQSYVLSGHLGDDLAGCNVYPTVEAFNSGVVNHLGKIGACGQESGKDGCTVCSGVGYTVKIVYMNGNIKAGGHVSGAILEKEQESFLDHILLGFTDGYVRGYKVDSLIDCLFCKNFSIKGNGLCKYKGGVACIEVHEAVVSDNCAESGCEQTICNANGVALYKVVNTCCVLCLVNNCSVEECKRISGCSCLLEQILHIEVVACNVAELIDNVVNGVIKVAVNLCGQTVGDLLAGNCFELFYKYFEGGNGCKCIYEVLCFEVVGEVIAGYALNVREKNLCITGSECLAVYLAKECGINCFENSNDLFNGQFLSERDEIIGSLVVDSQNLILESVHFGIAGICESFKSQTHYACELGRNGNVSNELAVCQTNIANLAKQVGELCSCGADHIDAGSKNKVKVDFLGLLNLAVEVRNCKACGEQLAAVIKICELVESGNKVFEGVNKSCGKQLDVAFFVLCGNNNTVDLDLGDGLLHGSNNAEYLNEIGLDIEHTKKLLSDAGVVNNCYELLSINLVNESTNVDSLDKTFSVDNLGDNAIADDCLSDSLNVKGVNKSLKVGYVLDNGLVTANCSNCILKADSIDSCIVAFKACNNVGRSDGCVCNTCGDLILNEIGLNKVCITVISCQFIYADNVVGNQLGNGEDTVCKQFLDVANAIFNVVLQNFLSKTLSICFQESFQSISVGILACQGCIADYILDVIKICCCLNVDAVELYSLVDVNDSKQICGIKLKCEIHKNGCIIVNESVGIDVRDCGFDILFVDIVHKNVNVLNVGLQIHFLEQADQTLGIYACEQFVGIEASEKIFCIDIGNDRLSESNDIFLGENRKDLFLGQNVAKATAGGHTLEQSLNVAVLDVGQERLGINSNRNVGGRYVVVLRLVSFYVQPIVSKRTDRQNCQNSNEC